MAEYKPKTRNKMKRSTPQRGKKTKAHKRPPQEMSKEAAGKSFADIIQEAASKKKAGKL
jgi:hypothetical protein